MRMTKKKVIKYLKRKMNEIDKGDYWEYQTEWNTIRECVNTLNKLF